MREITLDDLTRIVRQASGLDSLADLGGDAADMTFTDLGCDSLAMLEIVARIETDYAAYVPEGALSPEETPRETIDIVNGLIAGAER